MILDPLRYPTYDQAAAIDIETGLSTTTNEIYSDTVIENRLQQFKKHRLDELKNTTLMNRVDTKFLLPRTYLRELLDKLQPFYSCLEIDSENIFTYRNQYFDTANLLFYTQHHNGKTNRYKVRQRHYIDTNSRFIEVKHKNNKKRTIKSRVRLSGLNTGKAEQLVQQKVGFSLSDLHVTQVGGYQRIALANKEYRERLTLDINLWYQSPENGSLVELPDIFIAELKQHKINKHSPFFQIMSSSHFHPLRFSKYCIGCALLFGQTLKTNRFKPVLKSIQPMLN
ncbi:polyphosphate polymerase domain-containing protein [Aliikangiella sp. G2MR2-5]|uniref:polyphosphate polymerase domain-containing protein n=1 Tax=Aliikangiella sp. G2MR2-5 TaxID=2788943 RepID=UPI0018AA973C|nr:polyphosphate polymerase domain-containing protein [Aliikangiella sp. G2MR2-5]